ncbi:hypothetical protein [Algoriphagus formosus]|uniref:hypothetical protein n=1 Tax=Algoriphagus formosus TaxID=2007308 RepID=UPI003F72FE66
MAKLKPNQFHLPSGGLITERPILFQTDMVKAILYWRKTQTRRNIKNVELRPSKNEGRFNFSYERKTRFEAGVNLTLESLNLPFTGILDLCPYGKPGDLLWVRETWLKLDRDHVITSQYAYKSNGDPNTEDLRKDYIKSGRNYKWKPSIHMPKDAARIWLMVEEVRVERLQDISEEDSIAEGIEPIDQQGQLVWKRYDGYYTVTSKPYCSFWSLWASINGEESWNANPWVWVVKFRVLSYSGKPDLGLIEDNYFKVIGKEVANG